MGEGGKKARVIAPWAYKLWYSDRDKNRNGVGIIIDCERWCGLSTEEKWQYFEH
jgi:hypothetical protein